MKSAPAPVTKSITDILADLAAATRPEQVMNLAVTLVTMKAIPDNKRYPLITAITAAFQRVVNRDTLRREILEMIDVVGPYHAGGRCLSNLYDRVETAMDDSFSIVSKALSHITPVPEDLSPELEAVVRQFNGAITPAMFLEAIDALTDPGIPIPVRHAEDIKRVIDAAYVRALPPYTDTRVFEGANRRYEEMLAILDMMINMPDQVRELMLDLEQARDTEAFQIAVVSLIRTPIPDHYYEMVGEGLTAAFNQVVANTPNTHPAAVDIRLDYGRGLRRLRLLVPADCQPDTESAQLETAGAAAE